MFLSPSLLHSLSPPLPVPSPLSKKLIIVFSSQDFKNVAHIKSYICIKKYTYISLTDSKAIHQIVNSSFFKDLRFGGQGGGSGQEELEETFCFTLDASDLFEFHSSEHVL